MCSAYQRPRCNSEAGGAGLDRDDLEHVPDLGQGFERVAHLGLGVGRGHVATEPLGPGRNAGGDERHHDDVSAVIQVRAEGQGLDLVADHDRGDVRLARPEVEAELDQTIAEKLGVLGQALTVLGLVFDDVEGLGGRGDLADRRRRRKHERPCGELDVVHQLPVPERETSDATEGLREGPDQQVDLVEDAEFLGHPTSGGAERAQTVRIVDDQARIVLLAQVDDVVELSVVTVDAVEPLDHHQLLVVLRGLEHLLQRLHVVVLEQAHLEVGVLAQSEHHRVHDAGVVEAVENDGDVVVEERNDGPDQRLVAGGEHRARLPAEPLGQTPLELEVLRGRGLRPRTAEPRAVVLGRLDHRLDQSLVLRQTEVVVRGEVDEAARADLDPRPHVFEGLEEGEGLLRLRLVGPREQVLGPFVQPGHGAAGPYDVLCGAASAPSQSPAGPSFRPKARLGVRPLGVASPGEGTLVPVEDRDGQAVKRGVRALRHFLWPVTGHVVLRDPTSHALAELLALACLACRKNLDPFDRHGSGFYAIAEPCAMAQPDYFECRSDSRRTRRSAAGGDGE